MQFKTHTAKDGSKSWAVVRWMYDPSKGRSRPEHVGTILESELRRAHRPSDLMIDDKLEPEEREEVAEFYKTTRPAIARERQERVLRDAFRDTDGVVDAIQAGVATPEAAVALWERMDRVGEALREAGLERPEPRKAARGEDHVVPEPASTETA